MCGEKGYKLPLLERKRNKKEEEKEMLEDVLSIEEKNDIEKELAKAIYRIKKYKENLAEIEKI